MFTITAKTRLGWGKTAQALVFTTSDRELPQAPSTPKISESQIESDRITFNWIPGRDGFAPLRFYTIQYTENHGSWSSISERVDPHRNSFTVSKLKPFTFYKFRIQATNDIGPSAFSNETVEVRTLSAAPNKAVTHLKAVPITTNSVHVIWKSIEMTFWNGDFSSGGYKVSYQPISDLSTELQAVEYEKVLNIKVSLTILRYLKKTVNNNYILSKIKIF